jgi:hypothetical protein
MATGPTMRRVQRSTTLVLLLSLVASCSSLMSMAAYSSRDWEFIQSVGGIAVGSPWRDDGGYVFLPIDCDVSGLRAITVKPTLINSALVCEAPRVRVRERSVFILICTSLPSGRHDSQCPDGELGKLSPGTYDAFYGSPGDFEHPLGSIDVPAR